LGDVAEQTRISSLYLEAIENDDYKILPGGIFNKGFVKSYAKFVGVNEQEALMDYQAVLARNEIPAEHDQRLYKPEVLTDDHSGSMLPTIIVAALVLAILTGGILYLVSYLRAPSSTTASNPAKPTANTANDAQPANNTEPNASGVPDMASLKVVVSASSDVSVNAVVDGNKAVSSLIHAGSSQTFEPKQSLKLSYSRSLAASVQLAINGKMIAPPTAPLDAKKNLIEFELNATNIAEIWNSGSIVAPAAAESPTNTAATPAATPRQTPRPVTNSNASANSAPVATVQPKPSPKPTAQPAKSPHE